MTDVNVSKTIIKESSMSLFTIMTKESPIWEWIFLYYVVFLEPNPIGINREKQEIANCYSTVIDKDIDLAAYDFVMEIGYKYPLIMTMLQDKVIDIHKFYNKYIGEKLKKYITELHKVGIIYFNPNPNPSSL